MLQHNSFNSFKDFGVKSNYVSTTSDNCLCLPKNFYGVNKKLQ